MSDSEATLRLYLGDYLQLDRQLEAGPAPDELGRITNEAQRQKKAGEILEMARGFQIQAPALQAWLKDLGAQPAEQSRFGLALAISSTQMHAHLAEEAAYHYLQFETALTAKREDHFVDIMQGFSLSRAALTEAINKERPYFQAQLNNFEHLKNALEGRWKQESLMGRSIRTPEWAAQRYLIFVYDQNAEREKEAARILQEVVLPYAISPEMIEGCLEKQGASAAERDHFQEALTMAHLKAEKNRQAQQMEPYGLGLHGNSKPQLRLPAPEKPTFTAEDYKLELENHRAAEEHWKLAHAKKPEIDRFIGTHNGAFQEHMRRMYEPLPEPLTAEQAQIKAEVEADLAAERFATLRRSSDLSPITDLQMDGLTR